VWEIPIAKFSMSGFIISPQPQIFPYQDSLFPSSHKFSLARTHYFPPATNFPLPGLIISIQPQIFPCQDSLFPSSHKFSLARTHYFPPAINSSLPGLIISLQPQILPCQDSLFRSSHKFSLARTHYFPPATNFPLPGLIISLQPQKPGSLKFQCQGQEPRTFQHKTTYKIEKWKHASFAHVMAIRKTRPSVVRLQACQTAINRAWLPVYRDLRMAQCISSPTLIGERLLSRRILPFVRAEWRNFGLSTDSWIKPLIQPSTFLKQIVTSLRNTSDLVQQNPRSYKSHFLPSCNKRI
jgi:hypothetical protein